MQPKSHKTKNTGKKTRVAKVGTAAQAIGKLEKDIDVFILTYGQFSLIDALLAVIDQTGPAHVDISTWTAAHAHLDRSADLMASADILSCRMIVDRSFKTRQPKYYCHMLQLFGPESVREIRTHAKFITAKNDKWNIVIKTSMNLNEKPRLENIEITENENLCNFFTTIVDDVFTETAPGDQESNLPLLNNLKETESFALVTGNVIERSNLNEPKFTHEIRDSKGNTGRA